MESKMSWTVWFKSNIPKYFSCDKLSLLDNFLTYGQQVQAFGWLTESQYAVQVDGGLCQVPVLNKAEGLEIKSGNVRNAVDHYTRPLFHRAASRNPDFQYENCKVAYANWCFFNGVHFLTPWKSCTAQSETCCRDSVLQNSDPVASWNWKENNQRVEHIAVHYCLTF